MYHTPVLLTETLECLAIEPADRVIDATVGDGGHSQAMLERLGPVGRLLGLDASPISLERARARLGDDKRLTLVHANFTELAQVADDQQVGHVNAILFDLGIASWQIDEPGLGLSFQRDEPLDMRLDPRRGRTAADIVNRATPGELMTIFEELGGLQRSRSLVERMVAARHQGPIRTTQQLVAVIGSAQPRVLAPLFQALRMAVNDELGALASALDQAIELIVAGGRLAVISFHSGEDRVVKHRFQAAVRMHDWRSLIAHPLVPTVEEQQTNRRSRSAKLRAIQRVG